MKPLNEIKALDLSDSYAGAFCALQLSDFGAQVIKVNAKGREAGIKDSMPLKNGRSLMHAYLNRGNKCIEISPDDKADIDALLKLIGESDVMIVGDRNLFAGIDLHYEAIRDINSRIVYASITGFGESGEYAGRPCAEIVAQAASGVLGFTGFPGDVPVRIGVEFGDTLAGMKLNLGILMALLDRSRTGTGDRVEVSIVDSLIDTNELPVLYRTGLGEVIERAGNGDPTITPYGIYQTKDGFVSIGVASDSMWQPFCEALGLGELEHDPKYTNNESRLGNREALETAISKAVVNATADDIVRRMRSHRVPAAKVYSMEDVMHSEQLEYRNMYASIYVPDLGAFTVPNNPMNVEGFNLSGIYGAPEK
ncbi:MAG: CoA transferase [Spirochaetales bacterium]|nr:MAG: CoA transferase [Spirochaetales bacterium]